MKTQQVDVDKLIRQTQKYEFSDGLRELQMAVLFVLLGLLSWLTFEPRWWAFLFDLKRVYGQWVYWGTAGLALFFPSLAVWGMVSLMTRFRRRWLWRESGVVKAAKILVPRRVTLLSGIIMVTSIFLGIVLQSSGRVDDMFILRMVWVSGFWSTGYVMIALGRSLGLRRFVWLGGLGIVIATPLLFITLSFGQTGLFLGLAWGIIFGASGGVTLRYQWVSQQE